MIYFEFRFILRMARNEKASEKSEAFYIVGKIL
jgi:hypothetical protein